MILRLCSVFNCSNRKYNTKKYGKFIILKQCTICYIYNNRDIMENLSEDDYICKKCDDELINILINGKEYKNNYNY